MSPSGRSSAAEVEAATATGDKSGMRQWRRRTAPGRVCSTSARERGGAVRWRQSALLAAPDQTEVRIGDAPEVVDVGDTQCFRRCAVEVGHRDAADVAVEYRRLVRPFALTDRERLVGPDERDLGVRAPDV